MKYSIEIWTIKDLLDRYNDKKLDLSPPYQRKNIWSLNDQRMLIETVNKNWPMPNFFLLAKKDGQFEMVDGQQRSRTIIGYWNNGFESNEKIAFDESYKKAPQNKNVIKNYLTYNLSITIINEISSDELIHKFYALINSSGLHLNRPEVMKADYFETKFLKLITELAGSDELAQLKLFTNLTMNRMNDMDFIGELLALIKYGITDKKEKVDSIYKEDINDEEYKKLKDQFNKVIRVFNTFNDIAAIRNTRYKQKNDFYSLFNFVHKNFSLDEEGLKYCYRILVEIGPHIRPSQEECEPLMNYAINCVTQSNSKNARLERERFLNELLLNQDIDPNQTQLQILNYFGMTEKDIVRKGQFIHIDVDKINQLEASNQ